MTNMAEVVVQITPHDEDNVESLLASQQQHRAARILREQEKTKAAELASSTALLSAQDLMRTPSVELCFQQENPKSAGSLAWRPPTHPPSEQHM